jgi:hypothetical protein
LTLETACGRIHRHRANTTQPHGQLTVPMSFDHSLHFELLHYQRVLVGFTNVLMPCSSYTPRADVTSSDVCILLSL